MKLSSASQASVLFTLIAGSSFSEATRNSVTVSSFWTNYWVDWYDDGRDEPYEVIFSKYGVTSIYTFQESGSLKTLSAGNYKYTFSSEVEAGDSSQEGLLSADVGSRMLLASDVQEIEEVPSGGRRLYECSDCEETWDTLCDVGLDDVCYWVQLLPNVFSEEAQFSLTTMCSAFGAACDTSAFDTCEGQCTEGQAPEPTTTPVAEPTPGPIPVEAPEPTAAPTDDEAPEEDPTPAPTPASMPQPTSSPIPEPTSAPIPEPTSAPIPEPTAAPIPVESPEPTPAPVDDGTPEDEDACNPSPCQNGGSCSIDPAGGHRCSCAPTYGGMACQTETSSLDPFYIEIDFIGTWTDARRAVFQSAADRWSEVIAYVPCGGSAETPAGRLLISSTLEAIDGVGGTLGSAGPTNIWNECRTVSFEGAMRFDIDDVASLEDSGTFEGVILHEMGHVIGVGTLWGDGFGDCTTCRESGDPAWTCPAALSAYADIGGTDADIVETDGGSGTACGHLDEDIFDDELMTGFVDNVMYLSKMTASILDDLKYIVDPSEVDLYVLPSGRGASISAESTPSMVINDTTVDALILAVDGDGNVVDVLDGVMMQF